MDIEFDLAKDEINCRKHGVSLVLGAAVLMDMIGQIEDDRRDYGETRFNAFGMVNERMFVCSYTMGGESCRLMSVRSASRQEQRIWLA